MSSDYKHKYRVTDETPNPTGLNQIDEITLYEDKPGSIKFNKSKKSKKLNLDNIFTPAEILDIVEGRRKADSFNKQ